MEEFIDNGQLPIIEAFIEATLRPILQTIDAQHFTSSTISSHAASLAHLSSSKTVFLSLQLDKREGTMELLIKLFRFLLRYFSPLLIGNSEYFAFFIIRKLGQKQVSQGKVWIPLRLRSKHIIFEQRCIEFHKCISRHSMILSPI